MNDVSRSEQKRRYKRIEEMARELVELSDSYLQQFPGSEAIKREIVATRNLKAGARKRQIKYLAKLLRKSSVDEIYDFLSTLKGSKLKEKGLFHEAERLRDTLINEALKDYQYCQSNNLDWEPNRPNEVLIQISSLYTTLSLPIVQKLIFQYVKSRNKVHYRELFRMIMAAMEQEEIKRKVGSQKD